MFGLPSYHLAHLCTTCTKSVTSQDVSEVATVDKIHTVDVVRSPQRKTDVKLKWLSKKTNSQRLHLNPSYCM